MTTGNFEQPTLPSAFLDVFKDLSNTTSQENYYQAMPLKDTGWIHYELHRDNPSQDWRVEFHVEGACPDARTCLIEIAKSENGKRDFYFGTYYSSSYLYCRRPAVSPEQVTEDTIKLRKLIEEKFLAKINTETQQTDNNVSSRIYNLMPIAEVLKLNLQIPNYQRPYCWRKENVIGLLEDMKNCGNEKIHLGVIILKKDQNVLEIIDGQQRLITLAIFAKNVLNMTDLPLLNQPLPAQNTTSEALQYLLRAQQIMTEYKHEDFHNILNNAVMSVVILNEKESPDLAFSFFSHTNSAGMPLSDYDLLKTHHLRYLDKDERLARRAADEWNKMSNNERVQLVHYTLFRLRKWSAGEEFSVNADDSRLRELFQHFKVEMDPVEECSSWPRPVHFNSILDGGEEFFSYISEYQRYYAEYLKQKSIIALRDAFAGHSYGTLYEGMQALCFLFYCKFGEHFLPEAAYCIAYKISILRNETRVMRKYLSTEKIFRECTVIIDRATLEGEVFARLLDPRQNYQITNTGNTANNYWTALYAYLCAAEQSENKLKLPEKFFKAKGLNTNKEN